MASGSGADALWKTLDPAWLRRKYHGEGLNAAQIGKLAGVSGAVVRYAMRRHEIPLRGRKTRQRAAIDGDWLRAQYEGRGLSMEAVAAAAGVDPSTVRRHLVWNDIEIRKVGGAQGGVAEYDVARLGCTPDCPGWDTCLDDPEAPCIWYGGEG